MAAKVITAIYGLVMMAVMVGIMLQIMEDGPLAPSSLFFFIVAGEMIIAALLHPQEFWCLPAGVVYYVTVPSMYMLLIVYAIFNLNNVSWGTREVATKKTKEVRHFL
jgi:chitin synthase